MIGPAVCIISQEYPPETAHGGIAAVVETQARLLARAGALVHVISRNPTAGRTRTVQDGVVVHRIPLTRVNGLTDARYVEQGVWSQQVALLYRELDEHVRFDVVHGQDYDAELLHLEVRPSTAVVVQLHGLAELIHPADGCSPGQLCARALEKVALGRADALLAPTLLVAERTAALLGPVIPPVHVLRPPFDVAAVARDRIDRRPGDPALRIVFVGRLEPNKGPDLALRALAALRQRGVDARLTLVGRDIDDHRRSTLLPLAAELGLDHASLRFVEQLDRAGVAQHLAAADVALLPSRFENLHTAAIEALAAGVPVVCGAETGLAGWLAPADGLRPIPAEDPTRFAESAADALADTAWRERASAVCAARVRATFDATAATAELLEHYAALAPVPAPVVAQAEPELAVVVLCHNAVEFTRRCVASVLRHTATPMRLVLVDNASTDETAPWLASITDPRVVVVRSEVNLGVSGGRNLGLEHVPSSATAIAFLDNDVEVAAGWDVPFVATLRCAPDVGIAGEEGRIVTTTPTGRTIGIVTDPGPVPVDMAIGFCMVMRAEAVRQIGRFDEQLGLFWHDDDDYGMRAKRLGWRVVHMGTGRVAHFEHRSSQTVDGIWDGADQPSELSDRNQTYLASKWTSADTLEGTAALVVATTLDALIEEPRLLREFVLGTSDDPTAATLVVLAGGVDEPTLVGSLDRVAAAASVELDAVDVLALNPSRLDPADEMLVAASTHAVLGPSPGPLFDAPASIGLGDADLLRALAARKAQTLTPAP